MEWQRLRSRVGATADRLGDVLRGLPDGDLPLARVTWTAAETGAHLVSLPRRYRTMIESPRPFPDSLAEENERELAAVSERDPRALADLLTAEVAELLDTLGEDGRRPVWYFTVAHTAAGIGAIMLTELLMHGLDLAGAVGTPWPINREEAIECVQAMLPVLVALTDETAARAATGTYHLHLRGGPHWTIRIRDGAATVEAGRPARADLHFSADPAAFLLNAYGHLGRARAVLTGRLVAWGRSPWLAERFSRAFAET